MVTYSFVVDNTAQVPIVAQSNAHEIEIYENDQAGSTDYIIYAPLASSPAVTRPAGTKTEIRPSIGATHQPFFIVGQIVGYVKTISGSITMAQVEN